jgi:ribonucleoside-diphosphate reductase alpha chain
MDTIATLTSIALQYGVPLEDLVNKFSHVRFEPSGFTNNPNVPIAKSLTDYIFRYLGTSFLDEQSQEIAGLRPLLKNTVLEIDNSIIQSQDFDANYQEAGFSKTSYSAQSDAPACQDCGAIMVRNGSCYKCLNCGSTSGCS